MPDAGTAGLHWTAGLHGTAEPQPKNQATAEPWCPLPSIWKTMAWTRRANIARRCLIKILPNRENIKFQTTSLAPAVKSRLSRPSKSVWMGTGLMGALVGGTGPGAGCYTGGSWASWASGAACADWQCARDGGGRGFGCLGNARLILFITPLCLLDQLPDLTIVRNGHG